MGNRRLDDETWEKELSRLARRIRRIRAAREGSADVQVIEVEEVWVKRHRRSAHQRIVIRLRRP